MVSVSLGLRVSFKVRVSIRAPGSNTQPKQLTTALQKTGEATQTRYCHNRSEMISPPSFRHYADQRVQLPAYNHKPKCTISALRACNRQTDGWQHYLRP